MDNPTDGLADAAHGNVDVIRKTKQEASTGAHTMGNDDAYRAFFLTAGGRTATNGRLAATNAQRPSNEAARNAEIQAWKDANFYPAHARAAYEGG